MKMLACAEYRQIAGFKNQNMSRVGSLANEFKISVMKLEIAIWFNHFLLLCMHAGLCYFSNRGRLRDMRLVL